MQFFCRTDQCLLIREKCSNSLIIQHSQKKSEQLKNFPFEWKIFRDAFHPMFFLLISRVGDTKKFDFNKCPSRFNVYH